LPEYTGNRSLFCKEILNNSLRLDSTLPPHARPYARGKHEASPAQRSPHHARMSVTLSFCEMPELGAVT
jgi:hypothetical protein